MGLQTLDINSCQKYIKWLQQEPGKQIWKKELIRSIDHD